MTILGIDLGTTNSSCAIWRDGEAKIIPNRLGDLLTPSVIGIDGEGKLLVGKAAKERLITHPEMTIAVFKRLMGTNHQITIGKSTFGAVELSSIVLSRLKEDAEAYLGTAVSEAIISVPAYFNANQRHATKQAGELAGFKVERIINEPTAAAMAYGLHERSEGTFMILDMGGGTFDVSILEFFSGVMEVHASAGDNFLGGEDFVDAMVSGVLAKAGVEKSQLRKNELQQITMQMETCKRQLSTRKSQSVSVTVAGKPVAMDVDEDWFLQVCAPLLLRVQRPIERALQDANISTSQIDQIVLVGGSTRLGVFRNLIGRMFQRIPTCHLDPDLVVTMGAAIQAALKEKDSLLDDVVLTDVCPYTLGTEVVGSDPNSGGGYFLPIIDRNSTIPISIVRQVQTVRDNQINLTVNIYQGENRLVKKNIFLGAIDVPVPKRPAGEEKIDIRYSYDMNGLLVVDIKVLSTGAAYNKIIEQSPGMLNEEEMNKSLKKLAALKFHPREQEENRALLARGERLHESLLGEQRESIAKVMAQFDAILNRQNVVEIKKAQIKLKEVLDSFDTQEWF